MPRPDHPDTTEFLAETARRRNAVRGRKNFDVPESDPSLLHYTSDQIRAMKSGLMESKKYLNDLMPNVTTRVLQMQQVLEFRYRREAAKAKAEVAGCYAAFEAVGAWDDGQPFPKPGQKVTAIIPGLFDMPTRVDGIVRRSRDGRYSVEVMSANVGGSRRPMLTKAWKPVAD